MRAASFFMLALSGVAFVLTPARAEDPVLHKACLYEAWSKLSGIEDLTIESTDAAFKEKRRILNIDNEIYIGQAKVSAHGTPAVYEFFCAARYGAKYGQREHAEIEEFDMGIIE